MARMTSHIRAAISRNNEAAGKVNVIYDFNKISKYYLLGLLNSKVLDYYYRIKNEAKHLNGGAFGFDTPSVKELPIIVNSKYADKIEVVVKQIINIKRNVNTTYTSALEQQIDFLVYHLYDLTYDEVLIVDPETTITKEEYETNV